METGPHTHIQRTQGTFRKLGSSQTFNYLKEVEGPLLTEIIFQKWIHEWT